MTHKDAIERGEHLDALLAHGGEIAADAAEGARALRAAEGAGDLLLHLDHADVALGLVVVEGDGGVVHESEHRALMGGEAVEEVLGLTLLAASPAARVVRRLKLHHRVTANMHR